jgi:hypothetical protein
MKKRIQENIWGNWNGYEGTRKVKEFGSGFRGKRLAHEWLYLQREIDELSRQLAKTRTKLWELEKHWPQY